MTERKTKRPPEGTVRPEKVVLAHRRIMTGCYEGEDVIDATVDAIIKIEIKPKQKRRGKPA